MHERNFIKFELIKLTAYQKHQLNAVSLMYRQKYNYAISVQYSYWYYTDRVLFVDALITYLKKLRLKDVSYVPCSDYIDYKVAKDCCRDIRYRMKRSKCPDNWFIKQPSRNKVFSVRYEANEAFYNNDLIYTPHIDNVKIKLLQNNLYVNDVNIRTIQFYESKSKWIGIIKTIYDETEHIMKNLHKSDIYETSDFECPILR